MRPIDGNNKTVFQQSPATKGELSQDAQNSSRPSSNGTESHEVNSAYVKPGQIIQSTQVMAESSLAKKAVVSSFNFDPITPPARQEESDQRIEVLKKQFPSAAGIHPFVEELFQSPNYDAAWIRNSDSSMSIVTPKNKEQYQELFRSVTDLEGREPYYGFGGVFENRFIKPGEYIDFMYPLKHNQGKPELTNTGEFQVGDNFSIVRIDLEEPHEVSVVASMPGSDIKSVLRDPESQEILAYSTLDEDLTIQWHPKTGSKDSLTALEEELKKTRQLNEDEKLSIEDVNISRKNDEEIWTVFSSSATQALMKHKFKLNDGQFELLDSSSESNFKTNNVSKALKLQGDNGNELTTLMISPKGQDLENLPTIVMAHGGPYASFQNISDHNTKTANFFAEQGFNVLMINHSGSTNHGLGLVNAISGNQTIAAQDLISATQDAINQGIISDSQKVNLFGHSFGGYAVAKAAEIDGRSKNKLFDAVVSSSPVLDFQADVEYVRSQNWSEASVQSFDNFTQNDGGVKPDDYKTPILFFAGHQNDGDRGTLNIVRAFTSAVPSNTHYNLVEFEAEGHSPIHQNEMSIQLERSLDFFQNPNSLQRGTELIKRQNKQNPISRSRMDFFLFD